MQIQFASKRGSTVSCLDSRNYVKFALLTAKVKDAILRIAVLLTFVLQESSFWAKMLCDSSADTSCASHISITLRI